ncbi:MAG: tRNA pseudouridine(55) synthase TruB [Candidatus Marinimicrobia bacterium]|jgi:tRNA pseudouridine55 synthase|nr:tRNA pseudouridine(55) synthase TruB [Candidatus Neomarinimicrobiota bacterium]MBT3576307.1 tRNA pseudouridine(55) synthase TruB [Candidatus Neomarinimicrobiota bacterium]MBT3679164.1 tRNA pseudouridine(55) synthase TruB [Candidatus Neomarinimicrobiota bacterium]MBT3950910.1 tRNA pseudouridine(55) synthase TruB [Candidatus Neomarinimicrobiota bacterium]MBT4252279.1 tRNA pseudouridine(55) synthase TruB [Candidatus Neomarinimicrobiota bacterium]
MISNEHIINIDKPMDWTSFDVVRKVRYTTRIKKVGHAGTLDPFATGVLIVLTGKNTKRQNEFMDMPKTYDAEILLGNQTDTGDRTGAVVETAPVPELSEAMILEALSEFKGEIQQIPPMYSAKKVDGQKLYKLARKGKVVERKPSMITIYDIELKSWTSDQINICVKCGRGTYIRVLAEDIAQKLGTLAHVKELKRTAIGDYRIEDALSIPEFIEKWKSSAA